MPLQGDVGVAGDCPQSTAHDPRRKPRQSLDNKRESAVGGEGPQIQDTYVLIIPRKRAISGIYTRTPKPDLVQISMRLPSVSSMKKTRWPSCRVVMSVVSTSWECMYFCASSMSSTSNAP